MFNAEVKYFPTYYGLSAFTIICIYIIIDQTFPLLMVGKIFAFILDTSAV